MAVPGGFAPFFAGFCASGRPRGPAAGGNSPQCEIFPVRPIDKTCPAHSREEAVSAMRALL